MSIAVTIEQTSAFSFLYRWQGAGPFLIFVDGTLRFGSWLQNEILLESTFPNTPPFVEVRTQDGTRTLQEQIPATVVIQWTHPTIASRRETRQVEYYLIQRKVDSEWQTVGTVPASGNNYLQWRSGILDDDAIVSEWRVLAVDITLGTEGVPREVNTLIVFNPRAPRFTLSYDETAEELIVDGVA